MTWGCCQRAPATEATNQVTSSGYPPAAASHAPRHRAAVSGLRTLGRRLGLFCVRCPDAMRTSVLLGSTVAMLLVPGAARAQTPQPDLSLTLDDAVTRALATSHRLAEAEARGDVAAAVVAERHAPTRPQVSAVGGYARTNHVDEFGILLPNNQLKVIYPDIPDNYRARLDVQWPIYTGGRLNALEAAAERERSATERDSEAMKSDVRLDATRAFWNLVVARESLRVVEESFARMSQHVRDVRNQLEAGLVPPSDVFTAQAQEARQRMLSIQAASSRDVAEADLARLIGAGPTVRIVPMATLEPPVVEGSFDDLLSEALSHRADRQALAERATSAEARQRAAEAGKRPTVAVVGGVDYARPNPRIFPRVGDWRESWDAGVNVNWPLFDGGRAKAEAAEASAAVRAVNARLAEFDTVIAFEIRQRWSELQSSRAAIEAAEVGVGAAVEARRVVGERFSAGVATSTSVVDAQVAVLQAQLDRTQAIASARLAEARLHRALGR